MRGTCDACKQPKADMHDLVCAGCWSAIATSRAVELQDGRSSTAASYRRTLMNLARSFRCRRDERGEWAAMILTRMAETVEE